MHFCPSGFRNRMHMEGVRVLSSHRPAWPRRRLEVPTTEHVARLLAETEPKRKLRAAGRDCEGLLVRMSGS